MYCTVPKLFRRGYEKTSQDAAEALSLSEEEASGGESTGSAVLQASRTRAMKRLGLGVGERVGLTKDVVSVEKRCTFVLGVSIQYREEEEECSCTIVSRNRKLFT